MSFKISPTIVSYAGITLGIALLAIFHPRPQAKIDRGPRLASVSDDIQITSTRDQLPPSVPASLTAADECLLWLREQMTAYFHYELICSEKAWAAEAEAIQITENFQAPENISRRVRFWHRIYSLFSPHAFVIHLAEHPEVILEVVQDPKVSSKLSAGPKLRRHLKFRRQYYSNLLKTMARLPKKERTEQMQRIDGLMAHIQEKDKFIQAAKMVRSQRGQRDYVKKGIEAASPYLPFIEEEFKKRSLPPELARIAFVESSFNLKAVSKVGASGVYQLMPFVARSMMRVNDHIDERRDPIKAGRAAAEIFQKNYRILGHWPLAVTAYNHGPFGIKNAVKTTKSHDIGEIITKYRGRAFGFASKNFYAEFLAMIWTLKQAERYFPELELQAPLAFENYSLKSSKRVRTIAKKFNTSVEALAALNPDILPAHIGRNGLLPRGYSIKLPKSTNLVDNWEQEAWKYVVMAQEP